MKVKACAKCVHYLAYRVPFANWHLCTKRVKPDRVHTNWIDGTGAAYFNNNMDAEHCRDMREDESKCGADARWFKAK